MFFGLFASQEKKMRDNASNWLELADKVYHYRRDVLTDAQNAELQGRAAELKGQLKERAGAEKLKLGIERLEEVLRRTGGAIYPKSALVENVEFFLVAAIVILGIRTYFVQPFKIPTNSMWPTYNGMTPEVFTKAEDEPSAAAKVLRFAAFGAVAKRVDAPASGELQIPIDADGIGAPKRVPGRTWLVIPTTLKEYTLLVDGQPVTVRVPVDFDFDWALRDTFFPPSKPTRNAPREDLAYAMVLEREKNAIRTDARGNRIWHTGRRVEKGQRILSFDILTGDQLFVDRMSYHFVKPSVGDGFVFRTGNIPGIARDYGDQYYIKRLVGTPGDSLQVRGTGLYRNGEPITGSEAFEKNAKQDGFYPGYSAYGYLPPNGQLKVEPGKYFAMGDNSPNSADGRSWGFVPGKDVVGRPLFVYYPFTRHWGPAR